MRASPEPIAGDPSRVGVCRNAIPRDTRPSVYTPVDPRSGRNKASQDSVASQNGQPVAGSFSRRMRGASQWVGVNDPAVGSTGSHST